MTTNWLAVLVKCRRNPRILIIILAIFRISICFWPQTGYLHPDEFFQSTDIVGGHYFQSKIQPVWEFKTDKPIRCMLIPSLLNNLAFRLATSIQKQPSAYLLLVAPRFIYTLLSFIIDLCLYKLCQYYSSRGLWYLPVSIIFQTSFVCLSCLTRSLSNTPEVVIFALLLVVVCQTIKPRFRIMFVTPTRSRPVNERVKGSTQLKSSILVGLLITLGTFNRPTFPCFALVPSIYWIAESLKRNSYNRSLTMQRVVVPIALSAALTAISISAFDTIYYNDGDFQIIRDLFDHIMRLRLSAFCSELRSNWIITPYNFVMYNTNVDNLSRYGLHLPYTHMAINIPLAFNVLGLMFYGKILDFIVGSGLYRLVFISTHRVYALMLLTTLSSTILLSFIPHQEFRFLLPLIVPLVFVFAFSIYASNKWLTIWLLINFALVYFYTSVHQAGVVSASLDLDPILKLHEKRAQGVELTMMNVVALKCYLVPTYQWNIPKNDSRFSFDLQDTFNDFNTSIDLKLGRIIENQLENPLYRNELYIMMPQLYEEDLASYLQSNLSIHSSRLVPVKHYSPHFSGEEFRKSIAHIQKYGLRAWRRAFGFSLLKLDLGS